MTNTISNQDDIIQVEDITNRIEEEEKLDPIISKSTSELESLIKFLDDLKGNGGDHQWRGDWYPQSAIRESYFETAMDEMLEDIGDIPTNLPSYLTITVDYKALQMDYTSAEFEGVTYYFR